MAPWKELDPMTFDPVNKLLTVSNAEFKIISTKERKNPGQDWTDSSINIFENMATIDKEIQLAIQRRTNVSQGQETKIFIYRDSKQVQITMERTK
jgi:hypothetical protein